MTAYEALMKDLTAGADEVLIREHFKKAVYQILLSEGKYLKCDGKDIEDFFDGVDKVIGTSGGHLANAYQILIKEKDATKSLGFIRSTLGERVKTEYFAPYFIKKCRKRRDGTWISRLYPGMVWDPKKRIWKGEYDGKFAVRLLPPPEKEAM